MVTCAWESQESNVDELTADGHCVLTDILKLSYSSLVLISTPFVTSS
jgi:hypothetical protein